jgi:hypothetical protein
VITETPKGALCSKLGRKRKMNEWIGVLEKLTVTQLKKKLPFVKLKASVSFSQEHESRI